MAQFFYDEQVKHFLLQFARIFSEWDVTYGYDPAGNPILHRVPIIYGDPSRQAADIIAKNSASNMPSAPQIVYYITGLDFDQSRMQDPTYVDSTSVRQRTYNPDTGEFESTQANAFTIERLMPVPYTLRVQVDIWTSNYNQKLELFEQLGVLFNPSLELQSNDNYLDWTSLSVVYQDGMTWSSRSIPVGTGNPIDVMSWKFYMPIWISTAAKVKKLGIIQKIIATIYASKALSDIQNEDLLMGTRQKITPYGYKLLLLGNTLQILPADSVAQPPNNSYTVPTEQLPQVYWQSFLNIYGVIREGVSMIALENPYLETEIMGTITYTPDDDSILQYNIDPDTLPSNTLQPVDSIIDPLVKQPGNGLPAAANGQRYLIVNNIPDQIAYPAPSVIQNPWNGLTSGAVAGSIIQFNGTAWTISFDSTIETTTIEFVTNLTTSVQYRYIYGQGWMKSVDGFYDAGDWRVII